MQGEEEQARVNVVSSDSESSLTNLSPRLNVKPSTSPLLLPQHPPWSATRVGSLLQALSTMTLSSEGSRTISGRKGSRQDLAPERILPYTKQAHAGGFSLQTSIAQSQSILLCASFASQPIAVTDGLGSLDFVVEFEIAFCFPRRS